MICVECGDDTGINGIDLKDGRHTHYSAISCRDILKVKAEAGRKLAERALECSSELPHSVKKLAFAFFGEPCGGMCCSQEKDAPVPIRRGCICGPEGKCDYHRVTDVTRPAHE